MLESSPSLARESFHAACAIGDAEAVGAALARDAGQAVAPHEPDAWVPLLYVCQSPFYTTSGEHAASLLQCAQHLLDAGADANASMLFDESDPKSRIPALYFACVRNHVALVRLLLERGADPNDGESVYHSAELDHRECLELLVAHGAELSRPHGHWGNTPLFFLAGYRESDRNAATATAGMRWLLEHGADPNVFSGQETPLHRLTALGRSVEVVRMFLDHGADPRLPREDGKTAIAFAVRAGRSDVAELLAARGADPAVVTPTERLIGACMRADEAEARAVVAAHPDLPRTFTTEEQASVAHAADLGRIESVRLMAALGFDLGWEWVWGGTPLHQAAWRGNSAMVRELVAMGAPIDTRDRQYGCSALGWAAHGSTHCRPADRDYAAVIEDLITAGATKEAATNRWGRGPVGMASPAIARLLRERGFDGE